MPLGSSMMFNTKMLLQRTLESFKSCFSPGYEKLRKTNQLSYSSVLDMDHNNSPCYKELEKFYSNFTKQWESENEKGRRRSKKKKGHKDVHNERVIRWNSGREEGDEKKKKRREKDRGSLNIRKRNGNSVVEKKLREMEMLEMGDVDYVLDVEEVLHYYSRLTCPLYLEIVDKFFMQVYSEFFAATVPTPTN